MQNNSTDGREQIPLKDGAETTAGQNQANTSAQPDPAVTDAEAKAIQGSDAMTREGTQVNPGGRVADPGGVSGGSMTMPYDIETQADGVARPPTGLKTDKPS